MNDEDIICKYTYLNCLTGNEIGVSLWKKEIKNGFRTVIISVNDDIIEITSEDIPRLISLLSKCL